MKYLKYFLVLLIVLCSSALSGTLDPLTPDSKYIEYGSHFNYVVQIFGTYQDDQPFIASAVIIDDHNFLTAAHVVKDYKECFIAIKDQKYVICKIVIHKDFDKLFGMGDLAIGFSENSFELKNYPELYNNDDEINKICSICGYGATGTFITGAIKSDNLKRAGFNTIDSIYRDMLICSPSYGSSPKFTQLEFLIAAGDSGGGLFIDGKLAGINSCVMVANRSPTSSYGEESGHTRISKFIEWINENRVNKISYW